MGEWVFGCVILVFEMAVDWRGGFLREREWCLIWRGGLGWFPCSERVWVVCWCDDETEE